MSTTLLPLVPQKTVSEPLPLESEHKDPSAKAGGDTLLPLPVLPVRAPAADVYEVEEGPRRPFMVAHYKLGKVIGQGTHSKVRQAVDEESGEEVAVKIIELRPLVKCGVSSSLQFKYREIAIACMLHHPNVIAVSDAFYSESRSKLYLVQELVGGGTLSTLLQQTPNGFLSSAEARWYFRQLISGLEYVHTRGVIHRDIKPENLLLSADHVLKIADFGSSEFADSATALLKNQYVGTPAFFSPELADGEPPGFNVDLWAAGVTLYFLVVGRPPFDTSGTLETLFDAIIEGKFLLPDTLPEDLRDLLTHMLHHEPAHRLSFRQIQSHPWFTREEHVTFTPLASSPRFIQPDDTPRLDGYDTPRSTSTNTGRRPSTTTTSVKASDHVSPQLNHTAVMESDEDTDADTDETLVHTAPPPVHPIGRFNLSPMPAPGDEDNGGGVVPTASPLQQPSSSSSSASSSSLQPRSLRPLAALPPSVFDFSTASSPRLSGSARRTSLFSDSDDEEEPVLDFEPFPLAYLVLHKRTRSGHDVQLDEEDSNTPYMKQLLACAERTSRSTVEQNGGPAAAVDKMAQEHKEQARESDVTTATAVTVPSTTLLSVESESALASAETSVTKSLADLLPPTAHVTASSTDLITMAPRKVSRDLTNVSRAPSGNAHALPPSSVPDAQVL